ncbi:MAG: MYG1 family protein [Lacunisphaera sp.]
MTSFTTILTHPGSAHKDEFLACCVLLATMPCPIVRREPADADLADPATAVIDVGHRHEPALNNFDHHQFPDDAAPTCALSLVLQHLGLYAGRPRVLRVARTRRVVRLPRPQRHRPLAGHRARDRLQTLLADRRHAVAPLRRRDQARARRTAVGNDCVWSAPICSTTSAPTRARLTFIGRHAQLWSLDGLVTASNQVPQVLFLPRTDPLPEEPSAGLDRYVTEQGLDERVVALVAPDRRSGGYGLSRHRDHPRLDFTRIKAEPDVHFAHLRGFVAKTSATDPQRLRQLLMLAAV